MLSEQAISTEVAYLMGRLKQGDAKSALLGIGLDIETGRSVSLQIARFFLTESEQADSQDQRTLLRLWTVKEAIFKADPENDDRILGDYVLENSSQWRGTAYSRRSKLLRFHYSSIEVDDGFLSIAVLAKGERDA